MPELQLHPNNHEFLWKDHAGPFRILSEAQATSFDRDGFFVLRDVLDKGLLRTLEAEIDPLEHEAEEALRLKHGGKYGAKGADEIVRAGEISFTANLVSKSERLRQFVFGPPLVDLAIDLVEPNVCLYFEQSVYKKPSNAPKQFPWHQDNGYQYIEPQDYLTCWIPLTDATIENGCPWIWPGMHRFGTLAHHPSPVGFVCKEDDRGTIPVEVQVGDIVVFSSLTPHRTGPNTTDKVRKAYIVQYSHATARRIDGSRAEGVSQIAVAHNGVPVST